MKLILASNSPRRKELLSKANIDYMIKTKEICERWDDKFNPASTAMSLSYQKGQIVAEEEKENLVLSADTIVVINNEIIGKPNDRAHAKKIISKLSGNYHQVITAFSIICLNKEIKYVNYDISNVKFKKLTEEEIEEYLNTDEPYDKAGAYAIQGAGAKFVEFYEGDLDNIIGLPIDKVVSALKKFLKE